MRIRFQAQNSLDAQPISEVQLDKKSRHQLPALLAGLQYIFITKELNESIFKILEASIIGDKKQIGRMGMSLWEILVLGAIRLNLDEDYDSLYDLANNHKKVRGILGVETKGVFEQGKYYGLQTLKDNVRLLEEGTLQKISEEVVKAGHKLKKKENLRLEDDLLLELKTDSYAVEKNIHFPTDINLLWDSARKCLDVIVFAIGVYGLLGGFRKIKSWRNQLKKLYVTVANIHQRKGKNYKERLDKQVKKYLQKTRRLSNKVEEVIEILTEKAKTDIEAKGILKDLIYYHGMLVKHIDLLERRIIKGEEIPHKEKVLSIFEPETEWISKGKHHNKVELGHNTLITTDQYHFIVDHKVMEREGDKAQVIPLGQRLSKNYDEGYVLDSISFDRGFYSLLGKKAISGQFRKVVMPKNTKKTAAQEIEESEKEFVEKRKKHAAVESNINELEQAGVNRVPDKGMKGFKRYVALGVLAYNIKRLGKVVIQQNLLSTVVELGKKRKAAA